jgi:hypothetical protein
MKDKKTTTLSKLFALHKNNRILVNVIELARGPAVLTQF